MRIVGRRNGEAPVTISGNAIGVLNWALLSAVASRPKRTDGAAFRDAILSSHANPQRRLERLTGVVLLGLGIRLALEHRH